MIIVRLMGGLGNQMFQYAAGRRLAHIHRIDLKLDLSWFKERSATDTARIYELAVFNVRPLIATADEIMKFRRNLFFAKAVYLLDWLFPMVRPPHILEKHFHFDPVILTLPDNVYLEGYWQSPRYFKDIETMIRREFSIITEPNSLNKQAAESIVSTESVAVHVRRGDYATNPTTSSHHGTCASSYYHAAAEAISSRIARPHYYFFSDDPQWIKSNLSAIQPMTVIEHNGPERAPEDMRLMSLCKYHIIANSSFSWWGAWLSTYSGKIVIAPRRWFAKRQVNTDDLIPEQWLRL